MGDGDALWLMCKDFPLSFTIPGLPPSVNELYSTVRGRRVKTRAGHKWEGFSLLFVRRAALEAYQTFRLEDLKGKPLKVEITFCRPSWVAKNGNVKRPDCDNLIKALLDGIMKSLNLDDSAIWEISAVKRVAEIEHTAVKLSFMESV